MHGIKWDRCTMHLTDTHNNIECTAIWIIGSPSGEHTEGGIGVMSDGVYYV